MLVYSVLNRGCFVHKQIHDHLMRPHFCTTHLYIDFINKKLAVLCALLVFWNEFLYCDDDKEMAQDIICTVYIDVTVEGL